MQNRTSNGQRRTERPLLSGFDKVIIIIVILICSYYLSQRLGYPMKKVEEK